MAFKPINVQQEKPGLVGPNRFELTYTCILCVSYVMRMKEFERERRLLARKKRIEEQAKVAIET